MHLHYIVQYTTFRYYVYSNTLGNVLTSSPPVASYTCTLSGNFPVVRTSQQSFTREWTNKGPVDLRFPEKEKKSATEIFWARMTSWRGATEPRFRSRVLDIPLIHRAYKVFAEKCVIWIILDDRPWAKNVFFKLNTNLCSSAPPQANFHDYSGGTEQKRKASSAV